MTYNNLENRYLLGWSMSYENIMTSKRTAKLLPCPRKYCVAPIMSTGEYAGSVHSREDIPALQGSLFHSGFYLTIKLSKRSCKDLRVYVENQWRIQISLHCFCWGYSFPAIDSRTIIPHPMRLIWPVIRRQWSPLVETGEFWCNLLTCEGGISKSNSRGLPPTKTQASYNVMQPTGTCFFGDFLRQGMSRCPAYTKWITSRMDALKIELALLSIYVLLIPHGITTEKRTYPLHMYLESRYPDLPGAVAAQYFATGKAQLGNLLATGR